ncbi:MAG: hypothetical protein O8C66_01230 [Candidatus Methanoperedens sp.]|nr:hypothetical protein [Candidatus Methanoperedens sp.]MCZ7369110.1 hypothetical protein [Candidatus Methanoperedens sp.]
MALVINNKCVSKIDNLKNELAGLRKDLAKEDLRKGMTELKQSFQQDEKRKKIIRDNLYRQFCGVQERGGTNPGFNKAIDLIKANYGKDGEVGMTHKQEIGHLIHDGSEILNETLSDFTSLITPDEKDMKDMLEGLGLKHLIRNK